MLNVQQVHVIFWQACFFQRRCHPSIWAWKSLSYSNHHYSISYYSTFWWLYACHVNVCDLGTYIASMWLCSIDKILSMKSVNVSYAYRMMCFTFAVRFQCVSVHTYRHLRCIRSIRCVWKCFWNFISRAQPFRGVSINKSDELKQPCQSVILLFYF